MDSLLFLSILKGTGSLTYRNRSFYLKKGDCVLIDCLEEHEIISGNENPMVFGFIHFNGLQSRGYTHIILEGRSCLFHSPDNKVIQDSIRRVILALKRETPHREILFSGWIHSCLLSLMLSAGIHFQEYDTAPDPVKRVISYIEEYYMEELSLEDLAGQAALSKYHFTRLFKEHTGQTPYHFLLAYRLNVAKGLLINSSLLVGEISCMAGFQDLSHFNRSFRSHENMTPLEYRKNY